MADSAKKPAALDDAALLRVEVATLNVKIASLEATIRQKDEEIRFLRKPKIHKLDGDAADSFRRPFKG